MTTAPQSSTGNNIWFLIVFDNDTGRQVSLTEYRDTDQAVQAYDETEDHYRTSPRIEVCLLGADSEQAIRVTHSRYFHDGWDEMTLKLRDAYRHGEPFTLDKREVMASILAPFKHLLDA